jgi:TATA-binding protein-associated factor
MQACSDPAAMSSLQDILCDMTPLQQRLYDTVVASQQGGDLAPLLVAPVATGAAPPQRCGQGLEALAFMRKLCSHPQLVFSWDRQEHVAAARAVLPAGQAASVEAVAAALAAIEHSPKLVALRQLLADCGIVRAARADAAGIAQRLPPEPGDADAPAAAHRVLVFAQLKGTLDLVESVLLQPEGVSFARLDGDVPPARRHAVVQHFNADPTVDVLLLTTSVGGLGLDLTSADTVVFLEHDWNPMKDLQVRSLHLVCKLLEMMSSSVQVLARWPAATMNWPAEV